MMHEDLTSSDASGSLRVVLLLDDLLVPAWIYEMLAEIRKFGTSRWFSLCCPRIGRDRTDTRGRLAAENGGVVEPAGIFAVDP